MIPCPVDSLLWSWWYCPFNLVHDNIKQLFLTFVMNITKRLTTDLCIKELITKRTYLCNFLSWIIRRFIFNLFDVLRGLISRFCYGLWRLIFNFCYGILCGLKEKAIWNYGKFDKAEMRNCIDDVTCVYRRGHMIMPTSAGQNKLCECFSLFYKIAPGRTPPTKEKNCCWWLLAFRQENRSKKETMSGFGIKCIA